MPYTLRITPEGVDGLVEVGLDGPIAVGRNDAIVRNDHYDVASDGTHHNTE